MVDDLIGLFIGTVGDLLVEHHLISQKFAQVIPEPFCRQAQRPVIRLLYDAHIVLALFVYGRRIFFHRCLLLDSGRCRGILLLFI